MSSQPRPRMRSFRVPHPAPALEAGTGSQRWLNRRGELAGLGSGRRQRRPPRRVRDASHSLVNTSGCSANRRFATCSEFVLPRPQPQIAGVAPNLKSGSQPGHHARCLIAERAGTQDHLARPRRVCSSDGFNRPYMNGTRAPRSDLRVHAEATPRTAPSIRWRPDDLGASRDLATTRNRSIKQSATDRSGRQRTKATGKRAQRPRPPVVTHTTQQLPKRVSVTLGEI
jgi:hypothetical protein